MEMFIYMTFIDLYIGDFAQPVCLPLPGEIFPPKTTCIVAGWGQTKESKKTDRLNTWLIALIVTLVCLSI